MVEEVASSRVCEKVCGDHVVDEYFVPVFVHRVSHVSTWLAQQQTTQTAIKQMKAEFPQITKGNQTPRISRVNEMMRRSIT